MKKHIEQLIKEYKMLVLLCKTDMKSPSMTKNLETYIKGKKKAYERIVEDLEKLKSMI